VLGILAADLVQSCDGSPYSGRILMVSISGINGFNSRTHRT
jgi:hypothetical protein